MDKRRCKVGDLAFITGRCIATARGRIVKVLAIELEDEAHRGKWRVDLQGSPLWLPREQRSVLFGWISDCHLTPIRGEAPKQRAKRKQPAEAEPRTSSAPEAASASVKR